MAESPDFDRIVALLVQQAPPADALKCKIAEALRVVWNARGAADLKAVGACQGDPQAAARGYGRVIRDYDLQKAIRSLDR